MKKDGFSSWNISKLIITLLLLGLVSNGCFETTTIIPITISLSTDVMNFPNTEDTQSFFIETNTNKWSVAGNASWLLITPSSGSGNGTITITTVANAEYKQRTATIYVNGTGISDQFIHVTQEAGNPVLSVSPSSINFTSDAGKKSFSISSNISWTITRNGATWFTVSPSSGSDDKTIELSATENTSTTQRTATVTISGDANRSQNITVTQVGAAATLTVSPTSYNFPFDGGAATVSVNANTSWSVSQNASWLSTSRTSGSSSITSFIMTATANTTSSSRSAIVTVACDGITRTINVTQSGDMIYYCDGNYSPYMYGAQYFFRDLTKVNRNNFVISFDFLVNEYRNHWPIMLSEGWRIIGFNLQSNGSMTITTNNGDHTYPIQGKYNLNTWHKVSLLCQAGRLTISFDTNPIQILTIEMNTNDGDDYLTSVNFSTGVAFKGYLRNVYFKNNP